MSVPHKTRLSFKQAKSAFLVAIVLGLVISAGQIWSDLVKERRAVETTINQVVSMILEPAAKATYTRDQVLAEKVAQGLSRYGPVQELKIIDDFGDVLAQKNRPPDRCKWFWLENMLFESGRIYTFPLVFRDEKPVGEIQIKISSHEISQNFLTRARTEILSEMLQSFLLAGVLTLLFYRILTRPLLNASRRLAEVDPEAPGANPIPAPHGHKNDELGKLIGNINRLLGAFGESLERRKTAERKARENEDLYRSLVENIDLGVTLIDTDHNIIMANSYQCRMFNKSFENLVGRKCYREFVKSESVCDHCPGVNSMTAGEPMEKECPCVRDDGSVFTTRVLSFPTLDQEGNVQGFIEVMEDITERKKAEQAHKRTEERLRAIFEAAQDCIFIKDRELKYSQVNPAMEKLLGLPRENIVGKDDADLFGREASETIRIADRQVLAGETFVGDDSKPIAGKQRTFHVIKAPLRDKSGEIFGLCGIARDITERKKAEEALRASQERYKSLFESAGDAIFVHDENGRFLDVNKAACERYGYTRQEFLGMTPHDLDCPEDAKKITEKIGQAMDLGELFFEVLHYAKNGAPLPTEVCVRKIEYQDKPALLCIGRDITERRRAQEAMRKVREALEQKVEERTFKLKQANLELEKEIEDRIQMEQALRLAEKKYRDIVENAPVGIVQATPEGGILSVNSQMAKMVGYKSAEQALAELDSMARLYADADLLVSHLDALREHGELNDLEIHAKKKDGRPIWISVNAVALRNTSGRISHFEAFVTNITERKQAEEALRAGEERLRLLVDNIPVMIHAHDENDNYLFWNKECERVTGYSAQQMVGNPGAIEILYPEKKVRRKVLAELSPRDSDYRNLETRIKTADGKSRVISWSSVSSQCPIPGWNTWEIGVDVTENKTMEEELRRAKVQAEAANEAKTMFLANMSHEIRTPLNAVIGLTDLVLKTDLDHIQKDYLASVKQAAKSLLFVINDILDFSKIEAGKMSLDEVDFDIETTIQSIIQTLRAQAEEKGLELLYRAHEDVPCGLHGDPDRLRQILINLIGNAIKFTERGRISLEIQSSPAENRKSRRQDRATLLFKVSDTGIGIGEDQLESIFDTFHQADGTISRSYEGTGLGLAICKHLVAMMGGRIWVESEPGKGSTFYFTVVFKTAKSPVEKKSPAVDKPSPRAALPRLTILVAEDNVVNLKYVSDLLTSEGHEVLAAHNGEQVLEILNSGGPVDLVLMDIQMPGMDGLTATRKIRESKSQKIDSNIPIVALTAHALKDDRERFIAAGMNDYVPKPVEPGDLMEAIARVLVKDYKPANKQAPAPAAKGKSDAVLDMDALVRRYGGRKDMALNLVRVFLKDSGKRVEQLKEAAAKNDVTAVSKISHSLKGASGIVGALTITEKAKQIEGVAKSDAPEKVADLLPGLETEVNKFVAAAKASWFADDTKAHTA